METQEQRKNICTSREDARTYVRDVGESDAEGGRKGRETEAIWKRVVALAVVFENCRCGGPGAVGRDFSDALEKRTVRDFFVLM